MLDHQRQFIKFCIDNKVLKFGEFKLKSGRISPFFFNAGLFNDGAALSQLGQFYAETLAQTGVDFDVIFGPVYKGIPLVASVAIAMYTQHQVTMPYCYNRKEAKDHGEGGITVGADLKGTVCIIDDVITAGTAVREAYGIVSKTAQVKGVLIALDRQEKGTGELSAVQQVETDLSVKVYSIITIADVQEYLQEVTGYEQALADLKKYRQAYGI